MLEIILVKIVQTCVACPSQWDAWDMDGHYWYLRYRFAHGTAERQPSPDCRTWNNDPPVIDFRTDRGKYDGYMSLEEFCSHAGLTIHPDAVRTCEMDGLD